jgi:hypothetical protein
MYTNYLVNLGAALVPLVVGMIWFHPKIFGTAWRQASGTSPEKMKGANMPLIFALTYIGSYFIAKSLGGIVIHQHGVYGMLAGVPEMKDKSSELSKHVQYLMDNYGSNYRTFKHGAYHGFWTGVYFILPIFGILTLFERRNVMYFVIHSVYWIICLTLMGGIVCTFMP